MLKRIFGGGERSGRYAISLEVDVDADPNLLNRIVSTNKDGEPFTSQGAAAQYGQNNFPGQVEKIVKVEPEHESDATQFQKDWQSMVDGTSER